MTAANIAAKAPFITEETRKRKRAWCRCGLSNMQPFCDGAHQSTDFQPMLVDVEANTSLAWCGCKQTKTPPYCDGSHQKL